ncbi:putative quinol monooxygenase [Pseudomonas sp. dw_612]|uniref:putative quinol monooxygenase n=1 Tax=Pseudomonas sp. dw_612 TaxID=2720080 RepID=UPI001BD47A98|nr:putative quinol monooxygenase [Pseudomonas sp. dw_612]
MTEQPFILWVQARVKPEHLAEVAEAAARTLALTLQEPGCVAFHQTTQHEDPCHFCFFEYFASPTAHAEHLAKPYTKAFFELLEGKLEAEPLFQQLNLLAAG